MLIVVQEEFLNLIESNAASVVIEQTVVQQVFWGYYLKDTTSGRLKASQSLEK